MVAGTGTIDAFAGRNGEERRVQRAENELPVVGQERVRLPVERRAVVRAGVAVGKDLVAAADEEEGVLALDSVEALAAGIGDVLDAAEQEGLAGRARFAGLVQGLTPAILQMSFHSSLPTGTTERRDWRTSARSASLGSALMSARVTGVFTG